MQETFVLDGVTYRDLGNGEVEVVAVAPAPTARGRVIELPRDPLELAREARAQEDQAMQRAAADRSAGAAERTAAATEQTAERQGRNDNFSQVTRLAGDFNAEPAVKSYRVAMAQLGQALSTGEGPQADLALTYAFAKAMDPDSVVRESEQGMVSSSQPWFRAAVENVRKQFGADGAGSFTPEARDALRRQIINSVQQRAEVYNARRAFYEQQAQTFGIDPQLVVGQHDAAPFMPALTAFEERQRQSERQSDLPEGISEEEAATHIGRLGEADPNTFQGSHLGQGLQGVNEGLANLAGAPVDLVTGAVNLIPRGLNAIANTDIPLIENPVAGSQWWQNRLQDIGSIGGESSDPTKQFIRRVGESVGSSAVPLARGMTIPGYLGQLGIGAGGGIGAATAQQVAPGNPYAEMLGEVAGGVGAGLGIARHAQGVAQRGIEAQIPTTQQLREQAGEMYRGAEARGVTASPTQTQALADALRQALADEGQVSPTGRISEVYPKAREALQLADDYAGQQMTPTQLQTVRKVLTDTGASPDRTERRLGSILTDAFDSWAEPIAPELPAARDVASRYLNAETLEEARELAGARAGQFTGSGFENALRTDYRAIDRNTIRGRDRYPDALREAIENVSRGTPGSNLARNIGRFAPTGPVSAAATLGVPTAIGSAVLGGPAGVALGVGAGALGTAGRVAATRMGIRNADIAELIARNGGPIEQAPMIPAAFGDIGARLAAVLQAKYLAERQQQ